jgi:gas vesicle structural protein
VNIERGSSGTSVIDVLDRVLDKGIVIDAWVRVSLVGIDLVTVEARVVVASIETFMRYSEFVQRSPTETTVKQLRKQGRQLQLTDGVPSMPPTTRVQDGHRPQPRQPLRAARVRGREA